MATAPSARAFPSLPIRNEGSTMHQALKLTDKVALVTGAGSGIGRCVALSLAREGATVVLLDVNGESAQQVQREIQDLGAKAMVIVADVADFAQVQQAIARCLGQYGRLDILVNCAAILSTTPFLELTDEEWDRVMAVDLKGIYYMCKAVVPHMLQHRSGRIVNLASIAGKRGGGFLGRIAYATAKAGVIGFSAALARELAPYGITVNVVSPGPTDTPMTSWVSPEVRQRLVSGIPMGRMARPEEIAAAVVFLASPEASFITGEALDVDGGISMD